MDDCGLDDALRSLCLREPQLGYRAYHAKLKEEGYQPEISLKKAAVCRSGFWEFFFFFWGGGCFCLVVFLVWFVWVFFFLFFFGDVSFLGGGRGGDFCFRGEKNLFGFLRGKREVLYPHPLSYGIYGK